MGTINIVKTVKQVQPLCMVIVKVGTFCDVYSKDAYIISHLLRYKIKDKENIPTCSFPYSSVSKVENSVTNISRSNAFWGRVQKCF